MSRELLLSAWRVKPRQEEEGEEEEAIVNTSSAEWSRANWILGGRLQPCAFRSDAKDGKTVSSEAACSSFGFFSPFWESISEQPPGHAPFVPTLHNSRSIEVQASIFPAPSHFSLAGNVTGFDSIPRCFVFFYGGFKHNSLEMELKLYK